MRAPPDGVVVKLRLASHKSWVSSVCWSPSSAFLLASGSYDQTIKLWCAAHRGTPSLGSDPCRRARDMRATTPLHTLAAHDGKVLCLDWTPSALLSGGADNELRMLEPPCTTA